MHASQSLSPTRLSNPPTPPPLQIIMVLDDLFSQMVDVADVINAVGTVVQGTVTVGGMVVGGTVKAIQAVAGGDQK